MPQRLLKPRSTYPCLRIEFCLRQSGGCGQWPMSLTQEHQREDAQSIIRLPRARRRRRGAVSGYARPTGGGERGLARGGDRASRPVLCNAVALVLPHRPRRQRSGRSRSATGKFAAEFNMNVLTIIALCGFVVALSAESFIQARFWRLMRNRHPTQLAHFKAEARAPLARFSARATMLYLRDKNFRFSLDHNGHAHCNDNRCSMMFSYWATVITGCILLTTVVLRGW